MRYSLKLAILAVVSCGAGERGYQRSRHQRGRRGNRIYCCPASRWPDSTAFFLRGGPANRLGSDSELWTVAVVATGLTTGLLAVASTDLLALFILLVGEPTAAGCLL